jgi:zinc transporter ZupT
MPLADGPLIVPLALSTAAGLSTSLGALIAVSLPPDEGTLACLFGLAIGAMATVSVAELWWHKAVQHGNWLGITACVCAGGAVFALVDPLLPKPLEPQQQQMQQQQQLQQMQDREGQQVWERGEAADAGTRQHVAHMSACAAGWRACSAAGCLLTVQQLPAPLHAAATAGGWCVPGHPGAAGRAAASHAG